MKYKITSNYCFHEGIIVDMYFINGVPFTFDDISKEMQEDPYIQIEAEGSISYSAEDMFLWSNYLIMEECHPLLFDVDLENPEELPCD